MYAIIVVLSLSQVDVSQAQDAYLRDLKAAEEQLHKTVTSSLLEAAKSDKEEALSILNDYKSFLQHSVPPQALPGSSLYLSRRKQAALKLYRVYQKNAQKDPLLQQKMEEFVQREREVLGLQNNMPDGSVDLKILARDYDKLGPVQDNSLTRIQASKMQYEQEKQFVDKYHGVRVTGHLRINDIGSVAINGGKPYYSIWYDKVPNSSGRLPVENTFDASGVDRGATLVVQGTVRLANEGGRFAFLRSSYTSIVVLLDDPSYYILVGQKKIPLTVVIEPH